jgi:hypothetical protein
MSTVLDGPRQGSRAYVALKKLNDMGGQASVAEWMRFGGWNMTVRSFHAECVSKLSVRMKIFARDDVFVISDDGLLHLGISPDAPRLAPAALGAPRYVGPKRPLQSQNKVRLQIMREGAFDYMTIPSLHGSVRVDHKTSLTVAAGAKQG